MTFSEQYLAESKAVIDQLSCTEIERLVALLVQCRSRGGRLFILGVGGSAATASHAVNDFRKLAEIEAYAPTDNVAELTARTNDEGWPCVFQAWLQTNRLREDDCVLVFSVGGGDSERNISPNIVAALRYAREVGAKIAGIVGRNGGYTASVADACVIVPVVAPSRVTPHTEAFHSVVAHLIVSHPILQRISTKWELERRSVAVHPVAN